MVKAPPKEVRMTLMEEYDVVMARLRDAQVPGTTLLEQVKSLLDTETSLLETTNKLHLTIQGLLKIMKNSQTVLFTNN
jgi:hypothetical protein